MLEEALLSTGLLILVAYTATGVLLGPVTGLVERSSHIHVLLGIGIFITVARESGCQMCYFSYNSSNEGDGRKGTPRTASGI